MSHCLHSCIDVHTLVKAIFVPKQTPTIVIRYLLLNSKTTEPRFNMNHIIDRLSKPRSRVSVCTYTGFIEMSALGHKRTISPILAQCPLPGAKRSFGPIDIRRYFERCGNSNVMSAFPNSGRSTSPQSAILNGSFRPQAAGQDSKNGANGSSFG